MWIRASHNLNRFHRQHVTTSRRLRMTQLFIWLKLNKPDDNHLPSGLKALLRKTDSTYFVMLHPTNKLMLGESLFLKQNA